MEQVIGLTEAETASLLGTPAAKEEKAPAKLWRYGGTGCAVIVIFYPELGSLTYRALNLDVRAEGFTKEACLNGVAAAGKTSA